MTVHRRRFLLLPPPATALSAMPRLARAQDKYPSRPVKLIVTVPAGGSPDIIGRLIAQWLSEKLGQSFFVENKPGATALPAMPRLARAQDKYPSRPVKLIVTVPAGGSRH